MSRFSSSRFTGGGGGGGIYLADGAAIPAGWEATGTTTVGGATFTAIRKIGQAPAPTAVSAPRFEPDAALTGDNVRLVVGTYAEPGVTVVGEITPNGIELTSDGANYTFTAGSSGTIEWSETPSLNGVSGATQTATLTVTDAEAPPPDPILSRYAAIGAGKIIGHWNAAGATGSAGSVAIPDATGNNATMTTKAASVTDVQDRVAVDGPGYIGLPSGINLRGKRLFMLLNPTAYVDDQNFMFDKQTTHETVTRFDVQANNTWRWRMFHPVNNGGGGGPTTLTGAWAANIGTPVLIEMQYATDRRLSLTVNGTQVYNAAAGGGTGGTHAFVNDFFMRDFGGAPFATTGFPCEFLDILLMETDGSAANPDDISAVRSALLTKGGIA